MACFVNRAPCFPWRMLLDGFPHKLARSCLVPSFFSFVLFGTLECFFFWHDYFPFHFVDVLPFRARSNIRKRHAGQLN